MKIKDQIKILESDLQQIYDEREAKNIARYFYEELYDASFIRENGEITLQEMEKISSKTNRLLLNEPLQYVLGYTYFYALKFIVNRTVLIPRPETEELVDLIIKENSNRKNLKILDIGTGSGCIIISLNLNLMNSQCTGLDISDKAIKIAKLNAENNKAMIYFIQQDIKNEIQFPEKKYDIIVSNPPYIHFNEKKSMHQNVVDFEPHEALFAPMEDALFFYKRITKISSQLLNNNGKIYFEIPETKSNEIKNILIQNYFSSIHIFQDLQGKHRIISGIYDEK